MTETPEHLRKRAEEARAKTAAAGGEQEEAPLPSLDRSPRVPAHLLERAKAARSIEVPHDPKLPGEPFDPPLSAEERERIAVAIVNMREQSDKIIADLMENARKASEDSRKAYTDLTKRHRTALIVAVLGTLLVCVLLGAVIALIAVNAG